MNNFEPNIKNVQQFFFVAEMRARATIAVFTTIFVASSLGCQELRELWETTGGQNWTVRTNWPNSDCCYMYGISCSKGKITQITLSNNNLVGSIPVDMWNNLPNLTTLILDHNKIVGQIPRELCNLTNLEVLSMGNNYMFGTIPDCIEQLTKLKNILLNNLGLSGNIPIGMYSVELLKLNNNNLVGEIPICLNSIVELHLEGNLLSGNVSQICSMTSLRFLYLQEKDPHYLH